MIDIYVIGLVTAACATLTLTHFALWKLLGARRANVEGLTVEVETRNRRIARQEQFGWLVATLIVSLLLAWLTFAVYQKFRKNNSPASAQVIAKPHSYILSAKIQGNY